MTTARKCPAVGTSCSTQADLDKNLPELLRCPAAMRFLSLEPLLEDVDLRLSWDADLMCCRRCGYVADADEPYEIDSDTPDDKAEEWAICPKCGYSNVGGYESYHTMARLPLDDRPFPAIDHIIIGCESGPGRRPCKLEWIESVVEQCDSASVAVWIKQIEINGRVSTNPVEWPEHLRRQELPK